MDLKAAREVRRKRLEEPSSNHLVAQELLSVRGTSFSQLGEHRASTKSVFVLESEEVPKCTFIVRSGCTTELAEPARTVSHRTSVSGAPGTAPLATEDSRRMEDNLLKYSTILPTGHR